MPRNGSFCYFASFSVVSLTYFINNIANIFYQWRRGVVVIITALLHSTKPELRFCASSNPARAVSKIRDGEDLWQWSRLEIRLNAFRRSTISQKQFIIIIIIITKFFKRFNYFHYIINLFVWNYQCSHPQFKKFILNSCICCCH